MGWIGNEESLEGREPEHFLFHLSGVTHAWESPMLGIDAQDRERDSKMRHSSLRVV